MMEKFIIFLFLLVALSSLPSGSFAQEIDDKDAENSENAGATANKFEPLVTASCRAQNNRMIITLTTKDPFYGLITSANKRNNSHCFKEGQGLTQTTLSLNMLASIKDFDYCGVSLNHKTAEKTAQITVRQNRVLELAEDKNYLVSCGKFESSPPTAQKPLKLALYDSQNRQALEVVKTHAYKLRVETIDGNFRVRNCFAFNNDLSRIPLFDGEGCPESKIISHWTFAGNSAESTIYQMFRFQESRSLSFQCHVLFCGDKCPNPICSDKTAYNLPLEALPLINSNETDAIASTTVTVLDPGEKLAPLTLAATPLSLSDQCTGSICPTWLLWLCIIFGVLFLLMLLVNLFLCTALTCTCTRTELIEKEPSINDYDPYNNSRYSDSNYNSRYSINNLQQQHGKYSDMSDYATPTTNQHHQSSRPNSRFN